MEVFVVVGGIVGIVSISERTLVAFAAIVVIIVVAVDNNNDIYIVAHVVGEGGRTLVAFAAILIAIIIVIVVFFIVVVLFVLIVIIAHPTLSQPPIRNKTNRERHTLSILLVNVWRNVWCESNSG